jgi:hypothetical protein
VTSDGARRADRPPADDYHVGIVPDGVARVVWTFANARRHHRYVVHAQAAKTSSSHRFTPAARSCCTPPGTPPTVPSSRPQTPRALLSAFAVFGVTSRAGVKIGSLTISHPALSSLPLGILSITAHAGNPRFNPELDPKDIRQATTRSGVSAWIIPGARGLCVAEVDKPQFPFFGTSSGMSCSPNVASAVANGAGLSSGFPGRPSWHYGVLPKTKPTLTIRTGPHRHLTIHPPDGVYIYRTGR